MVQELDLDGSVSVDPSAQTVTYEPRIALCLSGGGFRAALFHLGAVRRLNELGVLAKLDAVSCVSGGSILGAFLATRIVDWRSAGGIVAPEAWESEIAAPFRNIVSNNIRTGPLLARLRPANWFRGALAVQALRDKYHELLTNRTLASLPAEPRFIFSATDLVFGVNWIFTRDLVGDYVAGYANTPDDLLVADAVAASSCFPPVFDPYPISRMGIDAKALRRGKARKDQQALCGKVALNDGGNYDNFGLEPVWKSNKSTDPVRQVILVSDGGGTFDYQTLGRWFWQRWQRYASVQGIQGGNLRKRWLIERSVNGEVKAAYWGISSAPERYASNEFEPKPGYRKDFAERAIAKVRTDLDAFSEGEAMVLENHGYSLADAAVLRHLPELVIDNPSPYFLPHQSLLAENVAEGVLHGSSKRKLLGRS